MKIYYICEIDIISDSFIRITDTIILSKKEAKKILKRKNKSNKNPYTNFMLVKVKLHPAE